MPYKLNFRRYRRLLNKLIPAFSLSARGFQWFEYSVSVVLSFLLALITLALTIRILFFSYDLIFSKIGNPVSILSEDITNIFGKVINVFIAVEFMNSIIGALKSRHLKGLVKDVILITGLAIARKLIVEDYASANAVVIFGMGFVLIALGVFYYIMASERFSPMLKFRKDDHDGQGKKVHRNGMSLHNGERNAK